MRFPRVKLDRRVVSIIAIGAAVAGGCYLLGRLTADDGGARATGYTAGYGTGRSDGYFDGLNAGVAQGREEGRALQVSSSVAADSRQPLQDAFTAGYAAGENDSFGNYDGGWEVAAPYLVIVDRGTGGQVYRIGTRTLMLPATDYYLCPDQHTICSSPRH